MVMSLGPLARASSEQNNVENPYVKFINSTLVKIYVRKKYLGDTDILEHAAEISDLFNEH